MGSIIASVGRHREVGVERFYRIIPKARCLANMHRYWGRAVPAFDFYVTGGIVLP